MYADGGGIQAKLKFEQMLFLALDLHGLESFDLLALLDLDLRSSQVPVFPILCGQTIRLASIFVTTLEPFV